ncbi:hypothetical protein [Aquipluma nitroreducens]|uniref:hypothetical protein n=1 Tax=Aquipluma nitroreducens TaxID=2010828 RepID=UPI00296F6D74|nr:hypothetical protein [Aquipluma nitroreducens]
MKTNLFISILIVLLFSNCHEENNDPNTFQLQAEVLGSNPDCGVFSIKFTSELDKVKMIVGSTTLDGIYIAKNLPIELQQSGIKIKLDIRKIQDSELGACTAMGPSYPWIYVIKAEKINN